MKTYLAKLIYSPHRYTMGLEGIPEFLEGKKILSQRLSQIFLSMSCFLLVEYSYVPCSGGL